MRRSSALLAVGLLLGLLPVAPAHAAPAIAFLNPSEYSGPAASLPISDKQDRDQAVHLVAWVQDVPPNPLVEFEMAPATGAGATHDAARAGTDTWEAFVSVSHLPDGQYTLRAILYANFTGPGTGTEVASTEQLVTLNRQPIPPPDAANTVEITYPQNGQAAGFSTPRSKRANVLIDVTASEGTEQVRVLYTTSAPGTEPAWVECGSDDRPQLAKVVRCTLAEGANPGQVTALAAVANNTPPPSDPNPVADDTGDAHRVVPYIQRATLMDVSPEVVSGAAVGACVPFIVRLHDQAGRPMAAANIDVHAVGPSDQLRFGFIENTPTSPSDTPTGAFQAPERHVSKRDAIQCRTKANIEQQQGDHNIPGANDPQHIESTLGTDNAGSWIFALYSDVLGGTNITVWSDDDDDDDLQAAEVTAGARLGWGGEAPPPVTEVFLDPGSSTATTGSCVRLVVAVKRSGSALSGVNVDVHLDGPDSNIAFCTPSDATPGRLPDQSHTGGLDDADTRHLEGETDASGRFVFGVSSTSQGTSQVTAWLDETDDDLLSGETSRRAQVDWAATGERSISISSSRSKVRAGRSVRIFGSIDGADACQAGQAVRLRAKRVSGGRFRTIATGTTDDDGDYSFRIRVRSSKRYYALAPTSDACERARSRTITVRATR